LGEFTEEQKLCERNDSSEESEKNENLSKEFGKLFATSTVVHDKVLQEEEESRSGRTSSFMFEMPPKIQPIVLKKN
jgi:hypothetical protein